MAIRPSLRMLVFLLGADLLAVVVVWLTELPLTVRCALILSILLNLGYFVFRDFLMLLPNSWTRIALAPNGLEVVTRNGSIFTCSAAGKTFVSPYFVVIRANIQGHFFNSSRVIFPDGLSPGRYREFCVSLKYA